MECSWIWSWILGIEQHEENVARRQVGQAPACRNRDLRATSRSENRSKLLSTSCSLRVWPPKS